MKLYNLESYVENGKMTRKEYDLVCRCVKDGTDILVGGKGGTGKTTLINAIMQKSAEIHPDISAYIIGNMSELKYGGNNCVRASVVNSEVPTAIRDALAVKSGMLVVDEIRTVATAMKMMDIWRLRYTQTVSSIETVGNDAKDGSAVLNRLASFVELTRQPFKEPSIEVGRLHELLGLVICLSPREQGKVGYMALGMEGSNNAARGVRKMQGEKGKSL